MDQIFSIAIPGSDATLRAFLDKKAGFTATTSYGTLSVSRSTWHGALLDLGREVYRNRADFGLVGTAHLRALERARDELDGLPETAPPLEWRVRARCLGCHVPSTRSRAEWREEVVARIEAVARVVDNTSQAGPLGRSGVRYGLVLADPPWAFSDVGTRLAPPYKGQARKKKAYDVMPLPEICSVPVAECVADDAILLLWAPAALAATGYHRRVAESWGFRPTTLIPWIKTAKSGESLAIGGGHYSRTVHEEFTLCVRGDVEVEHDGGRLVVCVRGRGASLVERHDVPGVIFAPRPRGHSRKPPEQYALAEALVGPDVPKIELFARNKREGWDSWGAEVPT